MTCSVVVCTHDRLHALEECLAAIAAGTQSAAEVIVIDSAPAHESAEQVAKRWGATYVFEQQAGLSRARNRGARESVSDVIAFLDDDAVPEKGWLEPLLAEFANPAVALVAGRLLPPETDMDLLPVYAWIGYVDLGIEKLLIDRSTPDWYALTNFGGVGYGANIAIRRSVFETWSGFDPRLGVGTLIQGCEEQKVFFELVDRGYQLVYAPGSVVRHAFPRLKQQLHQRAQRLNAAAAAYLMLLLFEKPEHLRETLAFIRRKLSQSLMMNKFEIRAKQDFISGGLIVFARLKGILLYLMTRLLRTS